MKKILFLSVFLLILLFLVGCAHQNDAIIKVPVTQVPPMIAYEKEPRLPIQDLKSESSPNVVIKAYADSIQIQRSYIKYLRKSCIRSE